MSKASEHAARYSEVVMCAPVPLRLGNQYAEARVIAGISNYGTAVLTIDGKKGEMSPDDALALGHWLVENFS